MYRDHRYTSSRVGIFRPVYTDLHRYGPISTHAIPSRMTFYAPVDTHLLLIDTNVEVRGVTNLGLSWHVSDRKHDLVYKHHPHLGAHYSLNETKWSSIPQYGHLSRRLRQYYNMAGRFILDISCSMDGYLNKWPWTQYLWFDWVPNHLNRFHWVPNYMSQIRMRLARLWFCIYLIV